jgi:hypothetical protein
MNKNELPYSQVENLRPGRSRGPVKGLEREPAGEPVKKKKTVSGQEIPYYTHEGWDIDRRSRRRRRRGKR